MKELIRQKLQESINFEIVENLLDEEYPTNFDIAHFKTLKSFNQRVQYCQENLQRISSGSSRIVYKIDNEKVLKLAKNKKGLAQNEVEAGYSQYHDLSDVTARVFEYNQDNLWIEMELARKVLKGDFQRITGFSFEDYIAAIHNYGNDVHPSKYSQDMPIDKEIVARMWEDEFVYGMFQYIGNYEAPVGDLKRLSSYGIVKRGNQDAIVMIDYGLTSDVYSSYYS